MALLSRFFKKLVTSSLITKFGRTGDFEQINSPKVQAVALLDVNSQQPSHKSPWRIFLSSEILSRRHCTSVGKSAHGGTFIVPCFEFSSIYSGPLHPKKEGPREKTLEH